jgi:hypothetical protein
MLRSLFGIVWYIVSCPKGFKDGNFLPCSILVARFSTFFYNLDGNHIRILQHSQIPPLKWQATLIPLNKVET